MADMTLKYLLLGEDKTASKSIKGVADTAEKSGSKFDGMSKVWAAGAAVAGAAFVKFGMDTVGAASDQNEVMSKSGVIFGNNTDAMNQWAAGASKSMGLSKTAALEAAAGFGDMFLQLGFAGDESAKMSKSVVQMSADLGSFNNLPTAEVADMMAGAFRGEYDSLQRLIPNINAARVESEAMAMTGKKNASELTAQEKAAATLAIVTKDSARAQGDFARTSDGLANSTKILSAEFENAQAELGQKLLPIVNSVVHGLTGLVGGVSSTVDEVSKLPTPVLAAVAALTAFHLLRGPLGNMTASVTSSVRPMGEAIRLAGMYSKDAGGGLKGLKSGLDALKGGASTSSIAMGSLRSVGSGLFGLMGGPWGVALMGASALLGAYASAQAAAKQDTDDLTASIDKQTGQFTQSSREIVANKIRFDVNPDDLNMLKEAGVELGKLADETLNGGPAFDARIAQLQEMAGKSGNLGIAARGLMLTMLRERDAAVDSYKGFQAQNELLPGLTTKTDALAGATGGVAGAAGNASSSGGLFSGVVKAMGDAASGAKVDLQDVNDELAEFYKVTLDARGASRDYEQAVDEAAAAVKENGRTLDIHTEKGRKNQAALDNIAASAISAAEANLKGGVAQSKVTADFDKGREAFIKSAISMGKSKKEAETLATQLGFTAGKVQELANKTNGMPASKKTDVSVPTAKAVGQVQTIQQEVNGLRGKNVPVTISVFGLGQLQAARSLMSGVSAIGWSVGHNARGTSNWRGGLTWLGEEGPELVNLPRGSQVFDARTSAAMASPSGSPAMVGASGGGELQPVLVQFVSESGRVTHEKLLRLKRTTGSSLGLD